MAKRSFQYTKRSREDIKERANARGGGFDSWIKPQYKIYKVREGKNLIRILPPTWKGARHYGYDVFVNHNVGVDNQAYLSLSKMKDERDPLAEARRKAEREGDEEVTKALRPTQRILMWVIDRNDEEAGPQLFSAPITVDKAIANKSFDDDTKEMVFIDDPEEGCDVRFFREGSGLNTKYPGEKITLLKPSPIHEEEDLQQEWLDYITENPIPDCLNYYDYEHIFGVYNGVGRSSDDSEEKPARRSRVEEEPEEKPRSRRAKADEDEDPPFEKDEETPKRTRSSKRSQDPEENEEETEDKPPKESIRDRLAKARKEMAKSDADD